MSRKSNVGREQILDKAMHEFWSRGFRAASIDALVREIGTTRFSLYQEFGGKDGLFEAALDHYAASVVTDALRPMTDAATGIAAMEQYFETLIADADRLANGCLMTNTMAELGHSHQGARKRTQAHFERVARAFEQALERAARRGELRDDIQDLAALSVQLATFAQGIWVCARSRVDARTLSDSARTMLRSLRKDMA